MLNQTRFAALWRRLGATTDPGPVYCALTTAYAEPHRAYHTAAHLDDCLAELDPARALAVRPDEVELALWFHDALYDPRAADNEERSAAWAADALTAAGVTAEVAARVRELILATKHAAVPTDPDARLLVDIDLAILGRPAEVFDAYDRAIRVEYQWVPEDQYRVGRARILRGFLARPRIYQMDPFHLRLEVVARANLARAIARLGG
jgi:predicted metal-dependent HD superfamily phosphohydrolase